MDYLGKLKNKWNLENLIQSSIVKDAEIQNFQTIKKIALPHDLKEYFKLLNGTNEKYDNELYCFYSFNRFQSIDDELKNLKGIPDYSNIVNTLFDFNKYYVFADYTFHMFSYAIKLNSDISDENEVLIICGDKFKKIANSFSEFIALYLNDSIELQFNI